jgi:hypothetical protein
MNNYMRNILCISFLIIIAACASTGNQNKSIIDGYEEELIDQDANHYRIRYEGPRWINKSAAEAQKVLDYSLLRSAELSLENDFPFFVILSNDSETREIIRDDPACILNEKNQIYKKKCLRYKSIGDLTSVFLKDPLEVEAGTNIIKGGAYEGKALFASLNVYEVISRRYNLDRSKYRFQEQRSVPDHMSASDSQRQSHVRDVPSPNNN